MPTVHPTATVEATVRLADDVVIGPWCVLTGDIEIGAGCRLVGNVYLQGPLRLGERNIIYPFSSLGFSPQDLKWDPDESGAGLVIGNDNTFREGVTIHRATSHQTPTRIGDRNFLMCNSHVAHDCLVGNNCSFANGVLLAGHVRVDDRAVIGGNTTIHQHARVGRGSMCSGAVGLSRDLPPFFMLTGLNVAASLNVIGLRRSGASSAEIQDVRWAFRTLQRSGLALKTALDQLRQRADRPIIAEYIEFIETSRRGICPGVGRASRSTVVSGESADG